MKPTIYWIAGPWPGKLAIVPRPRGGDWLADEVAAWRSVGIDIVVSALEPDEESTFDLSEEARLSRAQGMEFIGFPIVDRSVPSSASPFRELVQRLDTELRANKTVAIHCRQGVGRSAILAAATLIQAGRTPEQAFEAVSQARGLPVPETTEQRQWVERHLRMHDTAQVGDNPKDQGPAN
jgi:protein-tyrosine phosphatase